MTLERNCFLSLEETKPTWISKMLSFFIILQGIAIGLMLGLAFDTALLSPWINQSTVLVYILFFDVIGLIGIILGNRRKRCG